MQKLWEEDSVAWTQPRPHFPLPRLGFVNLLGKQLAKASMVLLHCEDVHS